MAAPPLPADLGLPREFRLHPNKYMRNQTTRRFYYLEAYKNYLVRQYVGRFNVELYPEVEARIERGMRRIRVRNLNTTVYTNLELRKLIREVERLVADAFRELELRLWREMKQLARDEKEHERSMVAAAFPASASKIVVPTVEQTTRVIEQRPFDGLTTSEWVRNEAQSQIKDVQRQIVIGVTQGEGTEQILQRVRGTAAAQYEDGSFGRGRRNLQAVLMGAVAHTATQTRQQFRDFNLDVLQRVQWSCVLDAATCLECMSWHGQVFGLEEGPRPPLHVRCRCLMIPVGPGEAAEAQTFDEWLAEQEDEVVVEALGVRRARLFRAGALKVGDFTNSIGRTYTLKELREKEPWAFRAAGID